ncbi:unnamed protein product [Rotaria sp. Silwood1]|nr:unnamed protein product [Rotaria sp. Silwood1]
MFYLAFTIILLGQFLPEVVVANSLLEATASEILPQLKSNDIRPREYVQHLIHHIKANEKRINALISFYPGRVLSSIKTTTEYQKERQCLNGLPIIVKDNIDVLGYPTTGGTPSLRNSYPKRNAPVISRLLSAGGVILGKANMHELAWSITSNNAYFGPVHNPWNLNLIPGGSSGGSAASVAARFAPIALCTDTGGSCRIPAALTGVVGFRPSIGRYSQEGVIPLASSKDTIGINARSIEDVVLIDGVLTQNSCERKPRRISLREIRLGLDRSTFLNDVDGDLYDVFIKSVQALTNAGVQIINIDLSELLALDLANSYLIYYYEWFRDLDRYLQASPKYPIPLSRVLSNVASPDVKDAINGIQNGTLRVTDEKYNSIMNIVRPELQRQLRAVFQQFALDGIIFPTTRLTARLIGQDPVTLNNHTLPTLDAYVTFEDFGSTAGVPGISIPIGLTKDSKLPVGMEIEGEYGKDEKLLNVAAAVKRVFDPLPQPTDVVFKKH